MRILFHLFTDRVISLVSGFVTFVGQKVTKEGILLTGATVIGTFGGLQIGLNRLFLWMVGPPRMSKQARLELVLTTLELKKTLFVEKNHAYARRLDRIARLLYHIQRVDNGPIRNRMRGWLDKTATSHLLLLKEKEIPRLALTISILEEAKTKLQDQEPN